MNLKDYRAVFDDMQPSQQLQEQIWEKGKARGKHNKSRALRMGIIAATLIVAMCGGAFAAYQVNWNSDYREFFNIQSEKVQGFVEYPPLEAAETVKFQPVSCVTGVQTFDIRFSYGPISQEEADILSERYDAEANQVFLPEEMLMVEVEELSDWGPHYLGVVEYDAETGLALFHFSQWYYDMPDQLTLRISRYNSETEEVLEELGTLVMEPEESEVKTAVLDLRTVGPDGREGGVVALRIEAGSYLWVQDIPGMEDWNGAFDAAMHDPEFSNYTTDWDNLLLEEFYNDAYLNFKDGTTFRLGAGISYTWDGEHYCQWSDCLFDLGNLVSVTINGVEYPFY